MANGRRAGGSFARVVGLLACVVLAGCGGPVGPLPVGTARPTPRFGHVFVIVLENEGADAINGSARAPYVNRLARQYGSASQYFAVTHPSLPNYIALTSGGTQGLDGSDCSVGTSCHVAGTRSNIADEIEASGRTWVAYMESMREPCGLADAGDDRGGAYAVRHDPFVYYDDIRDGANDRCATHVLPYDAAEFQTRLISGNVPDFVWITPNLCDDGHDACGGDAVANTDRWLLRNVPPILASPAFQRNGVLFLTWDEGTSNDGCCGLASGGGRVATLVISSIGRTGYQSSVPYDHYSLLRTIEDGWGLDELGASSPTAQPGTAPMSDFF